MSAAALAYAQRMVCSKDGGPKGAVRNVSIGCQATMAPPDPSSWDALQAVGHHLPLRVLTLLKNHEDTVSRAIVSIFEVAGWCGSGSVNHRITPGVLNSAVNLDHTWPTTSHRELSGRAFSASSWSCSLPVARCFIAATRGPCAAASTARLNHLISSHWHCAGRSPGGRRCRFEQVCEAPVSKATGL